jgi:hypothetical protein
MLSPIWEERLPSGWTWQSNFIGITTYADAGGNYPENDESAEYSRLLRSADEADRPRSILLEQRVSTWDIETRETIIVSPELFGSEKLNDIVLRVGQSTPGVERISVADRSLTIIADSRVGSAGPKDRFRCGTRRPCKAVTCRSSCTITKANSSTTSAAQY